MDVMTQDELIASIDAFQRRHPEIGDARIGREANGESGLVARLRGGSSPTLRILNAIAEFMAAKDLEAGFVHADDTAAEAGTASSGKSDDITAPAHAPVSACGGASA